MQQKKSIEKYAIIEVFPKALYGSNGLSTLFYFIAYFVYCVKCFFKIVFSSGKSKLKAFFGMFRKNDKTIPGSTSSTSYDLENYFKALLSLMKLKNKIEKTEINSYFGREAKEILRDLYHKGYIKDLDVILSLGSFSIRKEKIYFYEEQLIEKDVFVVREYTEPVIETLELKNKLQAFLSRFRYNNKHFEK